MKRARVDGAAKGGPHRGGPKGITPVDRCPDV